MISNEILEKIKKLLALGGNNPNENEARAALLKAAKLAEEHNLAISDIDLTTKKVNVIQDRIIVRKHNRTWTGSLIYIICKCFDCEAVYDEVYLEDGERALACFIVGMKTDVELCTWYVKIIQMRIGRNSEKKFKLQKDQVTFSYGAAVEVKVRLEEMFIKPREQERTQSTRDLVVVKSHEVQAEFKRLYPHTKSAKVQRPNLTNREAYDSGREYGKSMPLRREIAE